MCKGAHVQGEEDHCSALTDPMATNDPMADTERGGPLFGSPRGGTVGEAGESGRTLPLLVAGVLDID